MPSGAKPCEPGCSCGRHRHSQDHRANISAAMLRHGLCSSRAYRSWQAMKQRCRNSNAPNYSRYGGRGITVCERWLVFENFYADMGLRPEGTTLDRIDPDGDYEPGNCQWATPHRQRVNQRRAKGTA